MENEPVKQQTASKITNKVKSIGSLLLLVIIGIAAAYLINHLIFQPYVIDGTSMTPTLQNGDRVILSKVEHSLAGNSYIPQRGQIVILDSSIIGTNGQKEQIIKRVIGLPGDRVQISNGVVTVTNSEHPNGYDVDQDLGLTNLDKTYTDSPIDVMVPQGSIYVLGDNRKKGGSYDSRYFGAVQCNKIEGRLFARVIPVVDAQIF